MTHLAASKALGLLGLVVILAGSWFVGAGASFASDVEPVEDSAPGEDQVPPATPTPGRAPAQVPAATGQTADLTQATWLWQRTERSDGTTIISPAPTRYSVRFLSDGRLAIVADCNRVAGTYTQRGQSLSIQLGPTTLVACPPGSKEREFKADLGAAASYLLQGQSLVINLRADAGRMFFDAEKAAALIGTPWKAQAYNNGRQAVVSVLAGTELTANFGAGDTVTGSGGCNTYQGPYEVSGSNISIGPLATTRRACESAIMEQERLYLAALQASSSFALTSEQLTLADSSGARQALLVIAAPQPATAPSTTAGQPATATSIVLPDGMVCQFAGTGATLAFDGRRLNYNCGQVGEDTVVIVGTPTYESGVWVIERGVVFRGIEGFTLKSSETLRVIFRETDLVDGTKCANAGQGATLAFDGKRLNYTCGQSDIGLLGEPDTTAPLWTIEKVVLERQAGGFAIKTRETVGIERVVAGAPPR